MYQRDHRRSSGSSQTGVARRGAHPVLALQRLIGNRGTTQLLARETKTNKKNTKEKNAASFARSVRFGKFGPIEVKGGNVDDWIGTKTPDNLVLTTVKGKQSDELKELSGGRSRIDELVLTVVSGENTLITITISHALVKDYAAEGKTESWRITDFDAVNRDRVSIGHARP